MRNQMSIYVGVAIEQGKNGVKQVRMVFRSEIEPTSRTHGNIYAYVIGPFETISGAQFMADYGRCNPHCRNVDEAERLARKELFNEQPN